MSAPGRIADTIDRAWRAGWWYVLGLIGAAAIAWATYRESGPWWGAGVLVAGVLATVAVIVQRAHARRARRAVVTPPPAGPPPPNRVDKAVILAAIHGRPLQRPMSFRERYQIAVICSWRGDDISRIAANIGRSEADVQMFLAIALPAEAVSR